MGKMPWHKLNPGTTGSETSPNGPMIRPISLLTLEGMSELQTLGDTRCNACCQSDFLTIWMATVVLRSVLSMEVGLGGTDGQSTDFMVALVLHVN